MTFSISVENTYIIIIFVLMLLQIYQFRIIVKMKRELNDIWMSITNIIIGVAPLVTEKQLKKENEDKKS